MSKKKIRRGIGWWMLMIAGFIGFVLFIGWIILSILGVIPFHWESEGPALAIMLLFLIAAIGAGLEIPDEDDLHKPESLF